MKKQFASLGLLLFAMASNAQTTWNTTLNSGSSSPKFGLSTDFPLNFYTNNIQRMTLSNTGRVGIGTVTPVSELHVVGKGLFTGGLITNGPIFVSDQFKMQFTKGASGKPDILYFGNSSSGASKFKGPCNVWYQEGTAGTPGVPQSVIWTPSAGNSFDDLIQITPNTTNVEGALTMGVLTNGDGVIAIEPTPSSSGINQKLKINSGCTNDVYICEGGGKTKIFKDATVAGDLEANSKIRIGSAPFNLQSSFEIKALTGFVNAIYAWDPASTATNKRIFEVKNSGKTSIGTNLSTNNAMLTVGQATQADRALCLTDNTSTTNKDYFNVYGNGYTEINVYNPAAMPSNRVFAIKDMVASRDLFVVKKDGKMYAREVEISLATTFPDYVFNNNYALKSIGEVEKYITENKHLPGFEKGNHYEENGINVTDLLLKQQEKLEEQMLYIIQLEKKVQSLSTLEARLTALEQSK